MSFLPLKPVAYEDGITRDTAPFKFSILTYNILAQSLISRNWFPYCDQVTLKWKHRRSLVIKKLKELDADIMCLQEVDHFEDFYREQLLLMGYCYLYYANDKKKHGCCIAYKSKKFKLNKNRMLEFDNETEYPRSIKTGNVGILAELFSTEIQRGVVIANCHLFWSPDGHYERLRQALIMTKEVSKFKEALGLSAIICGDLNSQPLDLVYCALTHSDSENISELLEKMNMSLIDREIKIKQELKEIQTLIATIDDGIAKIKLAKSKVSIVPGALDAVRTKRKRKNDEENDLQGELLMLKANKAKLLSQLQLLGSLVPSKELFDAILRYPRLISCYSSYARLDPTYTCDRWVNDEPRFTNYTDKFKSTLDYIFIPEKSSDSFSVSELLSLPALESLGEGFPDLSNPSDHFPLMVHLIWDDSPQSSI